MIDGLRATDHDWVNVVAVRSELPVTREQSQRLIRATWQRRLSAKTAKDSDSDPHFLRGLLILRGESRSKSVAR